MREAPQRSRRGLPGAPDSWLQWRYRREQEMLYLTAFFGDAEYSLQVDRDGRSRLVRFTSLSALYDYLATLERQLGQDGWELMPLRERAPDRLRTPLCEICPIDKPVEVAARTDTHVRFRCAGCSRTWLLPKPGVAVISSRSPQQ